MTLRPPSDWPQLSSVLCSEDPEAALAWLERAFGFTVRLIVRAPDGSLRHSELTYGEALLMVTSPRLSPHLRPPQARGGTASPSLQLDVEDADAHGARARVADATILREPTTVDDGPACWSDRGYQAQDPEGHRWHIVSRVRHPPGPVPTGTVTA